MLCAVFGGRDPDQERFTRLYESTSGRLSRMAMQILGDSVRAEDAVHDTFMKLIRHYDELRDRPDERLSAWLAVVLKNTALDMLRRQRWETACEQLPQEPPAPADDGGFRALVAMIRKMPADYRQVLELRVVAEWSMAEIAQELELTESAVKSRIFRGRKLLMEQLRKEGYLDERASV